MSAAAPAGRPYLERFRLDGRVAVVTGGARGIGRAIAHAFCEAGARTIVADVDAGAAASTAAELVAAGGRAEARTLDVTDTAAVEHLAESIAEDCGGADILVNNAGIVRNTASLDVVDAEWQIVIDVNLTAVFRCSRAFGRAMVGRKRGAIVNISSMCGDIVVRPQMQVSYNASKAGVNLLTRSLAAEWAADGIRVNAVAPGYTATDLTLAARSNPRLIDTWLAQTPMRRLGEPQEIASVVLFLASDAASFVTGTVVTADGGYTVW